MPIGLLAETDCGGMVNSRQGGLRALKDVGDWRCASCGQKERATAHQRRKKYCSQKCAQAARDYSGAGEVYRKRRAIIAGAIRKVIESGGDFKDAAAQLGISRPVVCKISKEFKISKKSPLVTSRCRMCDRIFEHYRSAKRLFCSYDCHLKSGGAKRAGEAAAMAKSKYGAKKDANHKEIFEVIRSITAVHDLSNAGCGCPDGIAWINGGWQLFDVKNPQTGYGRRGLNKRQREWVSDWRGGPVYLIYNAEEALKFAQGNLEEVKAHQSGEVN